MSAKQFMTSNDSTPSSSLPARIRVAIVEDDPAIRPLLATWIEETDQFTLVGAFEDAETAAPKIIQHRPEIVLADINLPGTSGIELVRKLKPLHSSIQFVMLTVFEDSDHIYEALAAGATGYLTKKTERGALLDALQEVHAGGSPMSSAIARKVVQSFRRESSRAAVTDQLAKREAEVLGLLASGHTYKDIAVALNIGVSTVTTYTRRIYEKLQVHSRAQAVALYAEIPAPSKRR
jgi:DNA-binding NarL/FixJ family response regulator